MISVTGIYDRLSRLLADVVPEFELRIKAEVAEEVLRLKDEKNAIILGHNYMEPALFHSVPDYTGDSLYLSRVAAKAEANIIVFCGVRFMAETTKILNPSRLVLLPAAEAGCSLAASITAEDVRALKRKFPGAPVVSYVNCYAEVKAESDYCCTSGNATKIISALIEQGHHAIIFIPDEYLAANTARELGARLYIERPDAAADDQWKEAADPAQDNSAPYSASPTIIAWAGRCEVHEKFTVSDITAARQQFHDVIVLAHPECSPEVVAASDFSGSTKQMLDYVESTESGRLMLLTECAMGDNIASRRPDREILRTCSIRCPHMNEITLEGVRDALRSEQYRIDVPEPIRSRAMTALQRMIAE